MLGYDRHCRGCTKWSYFEGGLIYNTDKCPFCGSLYGALVLGEDVPRRKQPPPKLTTKERAAIRAARLAKAPAKGQYGYRGRK